MGEKVIERLKSIVNFSMSVNYEEEEKSLFFEMDKCLLSVFDSAPLLVFSLPKNALDGKKKNVSQLCRGVWNKEHVNDSYQAEEVYELVDDTFQTELSKEKWQEWEKESRNYRIFWIGDDEHQLFIGIFKFNDGPGATDEIGHLMVESFQKSFIQLQSWKELKKVSELIHIDDVTDLYNQRKLFKDLENLILRYDKLKEGFVLLFVDIDYFKNVNDNYGHVVGTHMLTEIAAILRKVLRDGDLIYRYGGDEFVMIVPHVSRDVARNIGERILRTVRERIFKVKDNVEYKLTLSIGIAEFPVDAKTRVEILELADKMMYEAKKSGRGRVCMACDYFN